MTTKKPEYLLTMGMVPLLMNRYNLDLGIESQNDVDKIELDFAIALGERLGDVFDYKILERQKIENLMKDAVSNKNGLPKIMLDDVYFQDLKVDDKISITRLVWDVNNFNNKVLGPRNGYDSLEKQISNMGNSYEGKEVSLIDIGAFEGESLIGTKNSIVNLLDAKGVKTKRIYLSVVNKEAREKIEARGIELVTKNTDYDITNGDWLESRDLLGFDGRKISREPFNLSNGTHVFARYIQDEGTLKKGANIQDPRMAKDVLSTCMKYNGLIKDAITGAGYNVLEGTINSDNRLYTLGFTKVKK